MRAIMIETGGGAEVLQPVEVPRPDITHDGQVLVRLRAAGVNPVDTKIRSTPERFPLTLPAILGCDGAGIVEEAGSGTGFKAGDAVYFSQPGLRGRQGTYAEYTVVDAALIAPKPASLTYAQAAAAPLVLITAWEALYDRVGLKTAQWVLVPGGAGGVGHVAVQLAKQTGCKVITTVSSAEKAAFVKRLGADVIVNYRTEDLTETVSACTDGAGVDVAFDTVGGQVLDDCFPCVKPYGDVVTILQPTADTVWGEARKRNLRISLELMLSPVLLGLESAMQHQGDILRQCAALFDAGKLEIAVAGQFPLNEAAQAHTFLESQHPMGKVVIEI